MLDVTTLKAEDLQGLSPAAMAEVSVRMLEHIAAQADRLAVQAGQITERDRTIKFKTATLEKVQFELARLKRWKFGARTEAMTAEQRQLFQDTILEDEADLEAQLAALQAELPKKAAAPKAPAARPRRQALPEHLRRVDHAHDPETPAARSPIAGARWCASART